MPGEQPGDVLVVLVPLKSWAVYNFHFHGLVRSTEQGWHFIHLLVSTIFGKEIVQCYKTSNVGSA